MTEKLHPKPALARNSLLATTLFFLAYLAVMGVVFAPKGLWLSGAEQSSSATE